MVDNNFKDILFIGISDLRKYIIDLEILFSKYSSLSEKFNTERAMKEFPNDWKEYIMPLNRKPVRTDIAKQYEIVSNSFKASLFKIKIVLKDNEKYLSHSNKKIFEQIIKSIEQLEQSPLFSDGLKEKNNMDCIKNIEFFEGGTGISLVKKNIEWIISSIGSLSFESKKHSVFLDDNYLPKIKDWILQSFTSWIVYFLVLILIGIIGINSEWL